MTIRKAFGLTMVHFDNKGILDGLWRGEMEMRCSGPRTEDADLDLDLGRIVQSSSRRHTGGSRTSKCILPRSSNNRCRIFRKIITEGIEKADELAKDGAMMVCADSSQPSPANTRRGLCGVTIRSRFSMSGRGMAGL